jgi:ABC-2 type transport system permease protein
MRYYISLYFKFIRLAWMQGMEYRGNFITWSIIDLGWGFMDLIFFTSLINFTQVIGDWNKGKALIVLGIFRLMVLPVWGWMFNSFRHLPKFITEGKLDLILTKPADSQFLVSTRDFSFSVLPSLITGFGFILLGSNDLSLHITFFQAMLLIWLLGTSTVLMYGIYFLIMTTTLYFDRLDNVYHIFTSLYDSAKYPAQIYPLFWQRIMTTIIPLATMIVVPAEILFKSPEIIPIINFHLLAIVFVIIGRKIWVSGLRRYSSASS